MKLLQLKVPGVTITSNLSKDFFKELREQFLLGVENFSKGQIKSIDANFDKEGMKFNLTFVNGNILRLEQILEDNLFEITLNGELIAKINYSWETKSLDSLFLEVAGLLYYER